MPVRSRRCCESSTPDERSPDACRPCWRDAVREGRSRDRRRRVLAGGMDHTTLGRSGAVVSTLALGTMTFGSEADQNTSDAILTEHVARGGTFVDTADVYSSGQSERIIGRWLGAHRTEAAHQVIATKGRVPTDDGPNDLGLSRRHL